MAHEARERFLIRWAKQQVPVVAEERWTHHAHGIELGRSSEGADDDGVQLIGWFEEIAPLDGPQSDLDQGTPGRKIPG
ncbi:MAG: hypothetical protein SX243_13695 [Acidobacteriota bacterium]|nr:hypothetical protein [Acidobacteriota bacterium]